MPTPNDREQQILDDVTARAATDAEFRKKLIANPRQAVKDAFGLTMPENFKIKFVEKEPGLDALVVLPDLVNADGELSEQELEAVAGGICFWTCVICTKTDVKTKLAPDDPNEPYDDGDEEVV